jgi:pyruvate dehydrogenase E1 component alpha subunit
MRDNISKNLLKKMYETMLRIRKFEEKVGDLVLVGEIITPCHLYIGEEAVATGVCATLDRKDYIFSNHRGHGHYIAKGGDIRELMAEIYCKKTGCSKGKGGSMHIVAPEVCLFGTPPIVAASIPLAVGTALSSAIKKNHRVSVSFFGDGATNEGVFYESLNFASLRRLPIVFVCENNFYSTHMPISKTLADTNIAKKAEGFNMPGIRIDGNNVIKVYQTAKKAIEKARKGKGPTLIECKTYRWCGHVGPSDDLDKGLRSKKELDFWMKKSPIKRLEKILKITKLEKEKISKKIEKKVEEAVAFAKKSKSPKKEDLKKDIFKS